MKLGLSTNEKVIDEALFKACSEAGIEAMEISTKTENYPALDFPQLRAWAEKYNIELWSLHLPFHPFEEIDISNPTVAQSTVALMKEYITKASAAGIKNFIIHPSGEPVEEEERPLRLATAQNSLKALAEFAAGVGAVICVEDLPRTCLGRDSRDILELISADERLRVVFDTNHLLNENNIDFIKRVGSRIHSTHVSDYDFINERHWLPGEGKVDWLSLKDALDEVGYTGPWLYEIGFKCPWSMERSTLTCADFKNNYDEIMSGKAPTAVGTPKENLGMWEIIN